MEGLLAAISRQPGGMALISNNFDFVSISSENNTRTPSRRGAYPDRMGTRFGLNGRVPDGRSWRFLFLTIAPKTAFPRFSPVQKPDLERVLRVRNRSNRLSPSPSP